MLRSFATQSSSHCRNFHFPICCRSIFFTNANSSKKQIVCVYRSSKSSLSEEYSCYNLLCFWWRCNIVSLQKRNKRHLCKPAPVFHGNISVPRHATRHILQAATKRFSSGLKESWQQLLNLKPWTRPICPAVLTKSSLVADMVAAAARLVD